MWHPETVAIIIMISIGIGIFDENTLNTLCTQDDITHSLTQVYALFFESGEYVKKLY